MLSTIHYVWAFLTCFEIHDAHFLACCFPWNSTGSLDRTGRLLCCHLLQSPVLFFNDMKKILQAACGIHPSLLPTASCMNWRHTRPAVSAQGACPCTCTKYLWWQSSCWYNVTDSQELTFSFPLLQENRYQLTVVYALIIWLLLS